MSRNRQTVRQRQVKVHSRAEKLTVAVAPEAARPQEEAPFSWDVAPEIAYARLRVGKCPKCAIYLTFDSKKGQGDYCYRCDHVWTDEEEEKIFHDAHRAELMKTA